MKIQQQNPQQVFLCLCLSLCLSLCLALSLAPDLSWAQQADSGIDEDTRRRFAAANPEDITNENFPDLIESFDYPDAEIADVVAAISQLTGKNFIIDPAVRGRITILAPTQITVAEAYRAFLSALAMAGATVVPSGQFLRVVRIQQMGQLPSEIYTGEYFPNMDQPITRIVKPRYINAEAVVQALRALGTGPQGGSLVAYPPTNSLIISDLGSNVERLMRIIAEIDVPGFEEQMEVVRVNYARARDLADMINQIVTKAEAPQPGVPRFRRGRPQEGQAPTTTGTAESLSLVLPDERTNSLIVVGNRAGIQRIRRLVEQLDFRMRPEDAGGVYVYYVRHSEAEQLANTLSGLAQESARAQEELSAPTPRGRPAPTGEMSGPAAQAIFGGNVNFTHDKNTNSLIITASRQDYEIVKSILEKIDIARDQVFVQAVIMEMTAINNLNWGIDYYRFEPDTNGIGRMGFRTSRNLDSLLNPVGDAGAILGFGGGDDVSITIPGLGTQTVKSISGFINLLQTRGGANILSTPQVMALDNEEAELEVGERIPVGPSSSTGPSGITQGGVQFDDATIKLVVTPFISPDTDSVQLRIQQQANQPSTQRVRASQLADQAVSIVKRQIKTQIVVNSGDTAVLGGLILDEENESITKVPLLGDIPILGWLFKGRSREVTKKNLLVFITPTVIRSSRDSRNLLTQKLDERIEFIQRNFSGRDPFGAAVERLPRGRDEARGPEPTRPLTPAFEFQEDFDSPLMDDFGPFLEEPFFEEPAVESF